MKTINVMLAVPMYYEKMEIGNNDIKQLFENCSTTAVKMKSEVQKVMAERGVKCWCRNHVNTKIAFEVWGLDIAELEKRYDKIKKYGG